MLFRNLFLVVSLAACAAAGCAQPVDFSPEVCDQKIFVASHRATGEILIQSHADYERKVPLICRDSEKFKSLSISYQLSDKNWEEARRLLDSIDFSATKDPATFVYLKFLLALIGPADPTGRQAFTIAAEYVSRHPEDFLGYEMRGSVYARAGQFAPALEDYNKSVDLMKDGDAGVFLALESNFAVIFYENKMYADAERIFSRTISEDETFSRDLDFAYASVFSAYRAGDEVEARRRFALLARNNKDFKSHPSFERAVALLKL